MCACVCVVCTYFVGFLCLFMCARLCVSVRYVISTGPLFALSCLLVFRLGTDARDAAFVYVFFGNFSAAGTVRRRRRVSLLHFTVNSAGVGSDAPQTNPKSENQCHALVFARGELLHAIDMNQVCVCVCL